MKKLETRLAVGEILILSPSYAQLCLVSEQLRVFALVKKRGCELRGLKNKGELCFRLNEKQGLFALVLGVELNMRNKSKLLFQGLMRLNFFECK